MSRQLDGPLFRRFANGDPIHGPLRNVVATGFCSCGGLLERLAYRNHELITRPWTACGYRCPLCATYYLEDLP